MKTDVTGAAENMHHWAIEKAHDVAKGAREAKESDEKAKKAKAKEDVKESIQEAGHYGANVAHKVKDKVKEKASKIGEYIIEKTKAIYEDLQEEVKHIADDLKMLKEDVHDFIKQKNEFNDKWMERRPVGKDNELHGEEAGCTLKGHETAHEVRKRFQSFIMLCVHVAHLILFTLDGLSGGQSFTDKCCQEGTAVLHLCMCRAKHGNKS